MYRQSKSKKEFREEGIAQPRCGKLNKRAVKFYLNGWKEGHKRVLVKIRL